MLILWWLQIIDGLGNYVIHPGAVAQILLMTKNIMNLG